jgi:deazaflavin-dependent oxidoreductase (nitroreductase family)
LSEVVSEHNRDFVDEFRARGGEVEGSDRQPFLLLHTTGAKSGTRYVNPVAYQAVGDAFAVFGSRGGSSVNPGWYHNLVAHPDTVVEVGAETIPVRARVAEGDERNRIWEEQKRRNPTFAAFEEKTTRSIPVVVLERASS